MNWDAIGAVGELLGSLAVLATLVYLSVQIRNAREELKHSIRQDNAAANRELTLEVVRNQDLVKALAKTFHGRDINQTNPLSAVLIEKYDLEVDEAILLNNFYVARLRLLRETIVYDFEFLDEDSRANFNRSIAHLFGSGAGKVFFEAYRTHIAESDDPVVVYVSNLISDST